MEDLNPNNNINLKSGDTKASATKDGIVPRDFTRALRKLIHDNGLESKCDVCGEHEILPDLKVLKPLGNILRELDDNELDAVIYCNVWNILQLCKNCKPMYKLMTNRKALKAATKWKQERYINWKKKYGTPRPQAIEKGIEQMVGYNGFIDFNEIVPANSLVTPMKENINKRWVVLGQEKMVEYTIKEDVDE